MKKGTEIWNNTILYKFGKISNEFCTFVSILMKYIGNGKIWAGKTFLYRLIENLNHILVIQKYNNRAGEFYIVWVWDSFINE